MKQCFKCKLVKPLDDFYRHPQMTDGHLGKCKTCCITYAVKREHRKFKDPIWLEKERERHRRKQQIYNALGKSKRPSQKSRNRWRTSNKEKVYAERLARRSVKSGLIKKLSACQNCGSKNVPLEMHHPDYKKPNLVVFLCTACHGLTRRQMAAQVVLINSGNIRLLDA